MQQTGMDPETFEQFLDQLERYVRERLIPSEKDVIEHDRIPDDIVREMKEMGLFGLTVPEAYGGAGLNTSQYARTVKCMAYAAPAFRSIFSINVGMFNSAIKNGGTEAQKAEWWPRIAAGEIACFGLTEPGSGSDSAAMQTSARPDPAGNGWILNGTKRYITNAPHAQVGLIMARTERENLPKNAHVSAFLVPMDAPGVTVGSPDKKMGPEEFLAHAEAHFARAAADYLTGTKEFTAKLHPAYAPYGDYDQLMRLEEWYGRT